MKNLANSGEKEITLSEIIQYAINQEIEAAALYNRLRSSTSDPRAQELFRKLEEMEIEHRRNLENFDLQGFTDHPEEEYVDFRLTDYMVEVPPQKELDFQQALILAAKREDRTRALYEKMAAHFAMAPDVQEMFAILAREEGRHKHLIEDLYDRIIHERS